LNRSNTGLHQEGADAIREIERLWRHGGAPYDPQALTGLYADDALFFGGLPDHYVGQVEIERYFEHYRELVRTSSLGFRDLIFRRLSDSIIAAQGFVDFTFGLPNDQTSYATLRATLVVSRGSDGWRILLQHFSIPPLKTPVPDHRPINRDRDRDDV
jgi:ketosteroid isomerase-like protein